MGGFVNSQFFARQKLVGCGSFPVPYVVHSRFSIKSRDWIQLGTVKKTSSRVSHSTPSLRPAHCFSARFQKIENNASTKDAMMMMIIIINNTIQYLIEVTAHHSIHKNERGNHDRTRNAKRKQQ